MHELTITENILEIALRNATKSNATQITDIHLVIGQLSAVIGDSVQFYWDYISKDTIAEGAVLHFRRIVAKFQCMECHFEFPLRPDTLTCPSCQGFRIITIAGDEFFLESIQIENLR